MTITGGDSGLPDEIDHMVVRKPKDSWRRRQKAQEKTPDHNPEAEAFAYHLTEARAVNDNNKEQLSDRLIKEVTDKINAHRKP